MKINSFKKLTFMVVPLFTLAIIGSLTDGCSTKQKNEQDLVYAKAKDAITLDPGDTTENESSTITQNIFEPLVRYNEDASDVEPSLAESWTISPDGREWTFKLRPNVKFHDGTNFDAESVKFNYDRQMDQNNQYRFRAKFSYWVLFFKNVKKIEVKDSMTVSVILNEKDPTFLVKMALFTMGIASPKAIKDFGKDVFKNPVGTGPFKFVTWVQNEKIVLKSNQEYWGEKPKIRNLIYKPIPDNAVRLLELENGSIQGMEGVNPDDITRIEGNKNLKLAAQPGMNIGYLSMQTAKQPFNNLKVRMALNYGINKDGLVKAFFADGKVGMAAINPMPPTMWGYNKNITAYPYDKEKAKQLLKESGADLSKTLKLWAMPLARPYMPQPQRIAESIQADLKDLGIKTEIVSFEWGTYIDKISKGEHDICLMGWIADYGDPDNFLYTFFSSKNTIGETASNYSFYKTPEMDKYLDTARSEMDKNKRTELYLKAQEVFHRDVPWVPLFHSTQLAAFRSNIMGFKLHPTGVKLFNKVYFENKAEIK